MATPISSTRPQGRPVLAAGALQLALALAGCTLISSADDIQCTTDDDCSSRGLPESVCSENVCVPRDQLDGPSSSSSATSTGGPDEGCSTNAQCSLDEGEPAICRAAGEQCVKLLSEDCQQIIGDYEDDNAIFYGIALGLTGAFEFAGTATIPYYEVALEEINGTHGGLPGVAGGPKRPLVGVVCDAADDAERAAEHLVVDIGVPAISTEYTSFVLALSNVTVPNGTFLLSATASLDQLDSLTNTDLVWSMAPRERDIYPAYVAIARAVEDQIRADRRLAASDDLKMALVVSSDLTSTGDQLTPLLELNGGFAIDDSDNFTRVDYDRSTADYALVAAEVVLAQPDIIVSITGSEAVDQGFITRVEESWPSEAPRPEWIFEKSAVGTPNTGPVFQELGDEFRARTRGLELLYFYDTPEHKAYEIRFESATGSPPAATTDEYYESNYFLAYLMMATRSVRPSGVAMSQSIPKLDGSSPSVYAGPNDYTEAGQALLAGQGIELSGAMGRYNYNFLEKHLVRKYSVLCVTRDEDGVLYVDVSGDFGIYDPVDGVLSNLRRCE